MMLKMLDLFSGMAGFSYTADKLGIATTAFCEIDTNCHKVLSHHWPGVPIYTDVCQVNGAEIEPADIVTFGSPCQDLSVAGKREGIDGCRSGLFYEAVRIIQEMRRTTNGVYPRFAVWENVPGAFSSNKGADFRAVLEALTESEIPIPQSGKWAESGMVRGDGREVAWRVLDAQYWGVPQRRKRIFLVADFRGNCAGEILFKPESVSGHSQESRTAREEASATAGDGITEPRGIIPFDTTGITSPKNGNNPQPGDPCHTLQATAHTPKIAIPVEEPNCLTPWDCQSKRIYGANSRWPTLYSGGGAKNQAVLIKAVGINGRQDPYCYGNQVGTLDTFPQTQLVAQCLTTGTGQRYDAETETLIPVQLYDMTHADEVMRPVEAGLSPTLNSRMGTGGNQVPVMLQNTAYGGEDIGNAIETNAREILRKLREEIGEEAFAVWGSGVLISLQSEEILQPGLHGRTLGEDGETQERNSCNREAGEGNCTESKCSNPQGNLLRKVWGEYRKKIGHTSQGWGYVQQFARELNDAMQELPQLNPRQAGGVSDMWQTGKGIGLLQQALHQIQEIRKPELHQVRYAVRRLVPIECLRLMGFPDTWLDIEGLSDSAKYRMIGNSVAIPCVEFVLSGIKREAEANRNPRHSKTCRETTST